MAKSLSMQHRKAISEGLKLHHKRKRRSKTAIGRLVNKFSAKTKREQRLVNKQKKASSKFHQIKALNDEIQKQVKHLQALTSQPNSPSKLRRMQAVRKQIQALRERKQKFA